MQSNADRVRVAIVGSGNIARNRHWPALQKVADQVELVAAVDVEMSRAREFAAECGIPGVFADVESMLAAMHPDLAIVCTPPLAHADAVIACLDAGVSVWCEKPPALSLAEYDEITAHEGENGPYASYVFQHRFGSGAKNLRARIASGELGRPLVGVCNTLWFRGREYFEVPWRGKWGTEGGGPTMGHGIHQMDLMLSILGDWQEVRAMAGTLDRRVETEDVSMAAVRMESGAMVSMVNSILSPREESYLRFDFTNATVELSHVYGYENADWRWTAAPQVDESVVASWAPTDNVGSSHTAQLVELLDALKAGVRPPCSGSDGRRSLEFITGLYQSAFTGLPVLRSQLTGDSPFYRAMSGAQAGASTRV